jgi:nucleoside phosphorylase
MLTLFIPSNYEAAVFRQALTGTQKTRIGDTPLFTGKLGGVPVRLAICGMGQPHSARRIGAVLAVLAPLNETAPVWLAGFGGGLDPALKRYDIVYLSAADGTDAPIRAAGSPTAPPRRIERVYTSDVVVDTEAKKVAAFHATGAPIVDMETGPFLDLLKKHGRTGAVIRVISDDVSEEFPADLIGHSHDFAKGQDTPFRLAWRLFTHPADIFRLRRFLAPLPEARRRLLAFVTQAAQNL